MKSITYWNIPQELRIFAGVLIRIFCKHSFDVQFFGQILTQRQSGLPPPVAWVRILPRAFLESGAACRHIENNGARCPCRMPIGSGDLNVPVAFGFTAARIGRL
jgi:hypothetical protein